MRGKIAFSDFRVFVFWPIFLCFCFWFCLPPKNYPQNFSHSSVVAKKQGKTRVFCLLVSWQFVLAMVFFRVVSSCSCFSSCTFFVANVSFVFDVLLYPFVFLLFSVMVFVLLFDIHHFNGPAPMTRNMKKPLKTPMSEIFVFDVLLWGLRPHTVTWPT